MLSCMVMGIVSLSYGCFRTILVPDHSKREITGGEYIERLNKFMAQSKPVKLETLIENVAKE